MGTTLTGTTPQDTYDSLIKVADNGPLSATAKFLSDGEGHDSALALSTTAVGIGTAAPNTKLTVFQSGASGIAVADISGGATGAGALQLSAGRVLGTTSFDLIQNNSGAFINQRDNNPLGIFVNGAERMTITSAGNVGIGTSTPSTNLEVSGNVNVVSGSVNFGGTGSALSTDPAIHRTGAANGLAVTIGSIERARFTADGLTFNGDTAAANALDDYEEGTWTMGVSFGGASVGVTTAANTGTYTKIGRQVTVNGYMEITSKGSSTGDAAITGLPFTIANGVSFNNAASLRLITISFADFYTGAGATNSTIVSLFEVTTAGVTTTLTNANFANNSELVVSLTYFV